MNDYIYPPPASLPPGSAVIAYIRDSGGPNQDESIGQQERVIQAYCKDHGLALVQVYAETASGRRTKNREKFLSMFNTLMTCPADIRPRALILWAYSRFSRDIVDFNFYLFGLIKSGMIIHSITEQIPDGIAGQMLLQVKAYTNADFSVQLGKQIKRSIADLVKAGYSNGGNPPKGYKIVREAHGVRRNGVLRTSVKWEPDPELAPLVRLAWELRAKGISYTEITKATHGKLYTSINSWVTHFRNESYIGTGKAGELRVEDHHEPLITWELWEAVRMMETENKRRFNHRRNKYPSLLAGLAYCIHCGAAMVIHTSGDYRSYICGKRDRKKGYAECPNSHRVNAPIVESLIFDAILNQVLTPGFVGDILEDIQRQFADTDRIDREIGEANKALIDAERSITRLVKLAESTGDIEEIKSRLVELKRNQVIYQTRIQALKAEKDQRVPQITPAALDMIFRTWREQIQNAKERGEVSTAKRLISQFVRKVELGNNKAIMHYTHPLSNPAENAEADTALRAHKKTVS